MSYHTCVDVGGTFTDLFAVDDETGAVRAEKVSTTEDAVTGIIEALRLSGIDPGTVRSFIFGSTRVTNALVDGRIAPVAFLGTEGFTDTLEIRRLWREHLFGWRWERPKALVPHDLRFGVAGRIDWRGREIEPLDLDAVDRAVERVRQRGIATIAVSLLFSFLNPEHERRVKARTAEIAPEITVHLSSDVNPEIKEYERASTTVVGASLSPLVDGLLRDLESRLAEVGISAPPQVIKSNGGVMSATSARLKPLEIIRSGPAGGVASVLRLSRELALPNLIGIDIGGTTADVSVITEGAVTYTRQTHLHWDIPIRVSMADVRSVGAGGGSLAWLDPVGRLHVGPHSAGANPGPACYARGGTQPTVTDAAIVAGLLDPDRFLGGRMRIDAEAARVAIDEHVAKPHGLAVREAAAGIYRIVTARMAQLIGEMTVQVGLDPRDYALVGFGGAGPLFVAALAEEIEAACAIVPHYPAVWSAMGGLFADTVHDYAQSHFERIEYVSLETIDGIAASLSRLARRHLLQDGHDPNDAELTYAFDLRYVGQSHEIAVSVGAHPPFTGEHLRSIEARFEEQHERTYAHRRPEDAREMTTLRLRARVPRRLRMPPFAAPDAALDRSAGRRKVTFHGHDKDLEAQILDRDALRPGIVVKGPAIVEEDQSNTVVPPGFALRLDAAGHLVIERRS